MAVSCWYLVVESLGKWWVDCEGKPFGPFDEMSEATAGAIRLAEVFGDEERQLQVMVPDEDGQFRVVWERFGPASDIAIAPPAPDDGVDEPLPLPADIAFDDPDAEPTEPPPPREH